MTLHNIEVIIKSNNKNILKISGQINGLNECANPRVIIYDTGGEEENTLGTSFPICCDMPLSEFLEKIGLCQYSAYSVKEFRPTEYVTSIKMKKVIK
mgnify:CR=1 FL=1